MLLPQYPQAATDYAKAQRLETQATVAAVLRQWRRMGPEFDNSWLKIAPIIVGIVSTAQGRVIDNSLVYIPAVLEETKQTKAIKAKAKPRKAALVGLTGAGASTAQTLALAPIRAKQAIQGRTERIDDFTTETPPGKSVPQALNDGGLWLAGTVGTILSDTGRIAEALGMYSRPGIGGYIRMLTPPSCSRCAVLAGRFYRFNSGFDRHPRCDCRHIPADENIAGHYTTDTGAYYDSLTPEGQLKFAGSKANMQALNDGADPAQIVNAYRKTSGMQLAQESPIKLKRNRDGSVDKYTTEGTTKRALAHKRQAALRQHGPQQLRLMPESIARVAKDDADRMRLLKLYGWIL